jgi:hypothetical protein
MMTRMTRATVAAWAGLALAWGGDLRAALAAPDPSARPAGERVRDLQRERVKVLEEQLDGLFGLMAERKDPPGTYLEAIRELGEAELDLADGRAAELVVLERTLRRLQEAEKKIGALWESGLQTKHSVAQARAARLKAEIQYEKRKAAR